MTTTILRYPKTEQERIEVHVLPDDFDEQRALALMERYCDLVEAGQYPPLRYVAALFSEVYEYVQARRAAEPLP